jgi:hypothetical protein
MVPRSLLPMALLVAALASGVQAESLASHRSRHWIVQLPADLAARRSAESWGAAADQRLTEIAGRLGVAVPA